jgi:hypothetical protein
VLASGFPSGISLRYKIQTSNGPSWISVISVSLCVIIVSVPWLCERVASSIRLVECTKKDPCKYWQQAYFISTAYKFIPECFGTVTAEIRSGHHKFDESDEMAPFKGALAHNAHMYWCGRRTKKVERVAYL